MRTYKYKLKPKKEQCVLIEKHLWACRFVWNKFLGERTNAYLNEKKTLNYFDNAKALTELKKCEDYSWLKEVNSQSLQATLKYLDWAYNKFFRKTAKFPRFKSKKNPNKGFLIPQNVRIQWNKLIVPKFLEGIRTNLHRPLGGNIVNATITKDSSWYYVSIVCDTTPKPLPVTDKNIGIDLWLTHFCITSDWDKIDNPRFLKKVEAELICQQRYYSKRKNKKTLKRIQKLHTKIKNQRHDFLHKLSTKLIRENQVICMEDLNVKWMLKNRRLSKSISDVWRGYFKQFLLYKADWYGRTIQQVDRFFPSSKTCTHCGYVSQSLPLSVRERDCPKCCSHLDRDVNASINILKQGLKMLYTT